MIVMLGGRRWLKDSEEKEGNNEIKREKERGIERVDVKWRWIYSR